jgi:gamma-glutamyltranspeptidase/glutathione hydrolase
MGHAFVDNVTYAGDPDHTESPLAGLASPAFAAARAAGIRLDAAAPRPLATADPWPFDDGAGPGAPPPPGAGGVRGTTQVVAADGDGTLVSLITTIGDDFGSLVAVPGTGILLNNSMMNYDPRPGRANSIAPGKMPFFAVPAIVAAREGRGVFAAAGSGGYPILAGVVNTMVNVVDHGMGVQAAIDAPRVHSQGAETYVDSRVPAAVRDDLASKGHELVVQDVTPGELPFSRVGAVAAAPDGTLTAGSGPAWNTAAGGL